MNVFHKVTLQTLKKNKTRTVVTVIGVILSAAMICAVTTFASSIQNYALQNTIYSYGNWYGKTLGTEFSVYEAVADNRKTEEAVYLQQLGYAAAEGCQNEFKPYIYLLGAGDRVENVFPVHITSGKYPTASNEILLPDHLLTNGGVKHSPGETITLSLGQRVLDGDVLTQGTPCYIDEGGETVRNGETLEIRETRTYTVVGFYERLPRRIEEFSAPGYTALTIADGDPTADYAYDVYFRTKKPKDIYGFMADNHLGNETNRDLLMVTGTFRFDTFGLTLYSLAAIVIFLIMFGSVALIYNAFSISVSERTRQFGLLSSVGATQKQLRRMVIFEAFAVSAIGIPPGILAGVGGIGITLLLIGNKFRSSGFPIDMTLRVSPASILTAAAVALITVLISAWIPSKRAMKVSAVEAIRQNQDIKVKNNKAKTSRLTYALFGLPGVLASKYYKRNRKKYRATVLSLFMSIVLFVSASAFTDYLTEMVSGGFQTVGYDLTYQASQYDFDRISPDELLKRIKASQSVTDCVYTRDIYGSYATVRSEFLTGEGRSFLKANLGQDNDDSELSIYLYVTFVDDEAYRAFLKSNGLREEKFMDPARPLAVALDGITQFNSQTQKYETEKFFSRDEFTVDFFTEEERTVLSAGKVLTGKPDFLHDIDDLCLMYPISLMDAVFADFDENFAGNGNAYLYNFTIQSDNHRESEAAVRTVLSENGFSAQGLYDMAQETESERNFVTIIKVFSYGFIVLISLIAAANVFNTISTNISLRRREFAVLKSVGMSGKGFNRMMNFECLLYGSRALLYGLPVSCGITYLIYRSVMASYETSFHLPWRAVGIAVLSVFLVVFVTMVYAMRKIKKENPIDVLKNENL